MKMQGYCHVYKWTILKRTLPEVKCLHPTSSRREICTSSVSNVTYNKFSHGAAFYTLSGKNVNVMLEFIMMLGLGQYIAGIYCRNFLMLSNLDCQLKFTVIGNAYDQLLGRQPLCIVQPPCIVLDWSTAQVSKLVSHPF